MQRSAQIYIQELTQQIDGLSPVEVLKRLTADFPGEVVFSTSFGQEDQVITDLILGQSLPVSVFTLDTGRLFPETYSVWSSTQEKYATTSLPLYPDTARLEEWVGRHGPNAFYHSVENRKACCYIRKVEPLQRALRGKAVWVTGLRAEHSPARQSLTPLEWDEANGVIKYHPLLHWSTEAVKEYLTVHQVPYNPLHDRGFISIGCAPCTRAVRPGEDFRAGRWWWEDNSRKECGLHEPIKAGLQEKAVLTN
jgi:phosphoadenosine phosphosulfate reductase